MAHANSKTEQPTPRRLQDARDRGQVAKSNDFNGAIVLAAATAMMGFFGTYAFHTLSGIAQHTFTHLLTVAFTREAFNVLLTSTGQTILLLLAPFMATVALLGLGANLVQVKPLFTVKPLAPNWDRINPLSGFKRLWSMRSIIEVIKALLKMTVVGLAAYWIIVAHQQDLLALGAMDLQVAIMTLVGIVAQIALWACIIFIVLGLGDWWYQRYELHKQLRMTKQEVKDERKNLEGDPTIKGKIRQMGIQMARKRQLGAVPTADVIITNPTHISIAIKYDPDLGPAPRVVAKGQEHFALKIREVAKANGVPIVENKPLARSLYAVVEVDHMIPPELFVAVAQVLAYVYSRKKGRRLGRGGSPGGNAR